MNALNGVVSPNTSFHTSGFRVISAFQAMVEHKAEIPKYEINTKNKWGTSLLP